MVGVVGMSRNRKKHCIFIVICIAVICVMTFVGSVQYFPQRFEPVYYFNSGYLSEQILTSSTAAIPLPDYLCHEGQFVFSNQTAYDICVFGSQGGFRVIEQGEYILNERPTVFFVIEPYEELAQGSTGVLKIQEVGKGFCSQYLFEQSGDCITSEYQLTVEKCNG